MPTIDRSENREFQFTYHLHSDYKTRYTQQTTQHMHLNYLQTNEWIDSLIKIKIFCMSSERKPEFV